MNPPVAPAAGGNGFVAFGLNGENARRQKMPLLLGCSATKVSDCRPVGFLTPI
jgi:hypothetical protein